MGDMGEAFKAMRDESRERRAANRDRSAEMLRERGIPFVSKNNGAHLLVAGDWSLWPGTGKWKHHSLPQGGRGVRGLIHAIRGG